MDLLFDCCFGVAIVLISVCNVDDWCFVVIAVVTATWVSRFGDFGCCVWLLCSCFAVDYCCYCCLVLFAWFL